MSTRYLLNLTLTMLILFALSCASSNNAEQNLGKPSLDNLPQDATAVPDGVDAELWEKLVAELDRVLSKEGTAKRTSAAPIGKGSMTPDLSATGATIYSWSYRNMGDYDLNGSVNISDLTKVGLHFEKNTLSSDWQQAQLADGDGNGVVNIADVTSIGQNFNGQVDGYEFQSKAPIPGAEFVTLEEFPFIPGNPTTGIYPEYTRTTFPSVIGPEYRVVPFAETGGPRDYGTPSNIYRTLSYMRHNWHTGRGNNGRDGLTEAQGPTDVGDVWQTELEGLSLLQEPIADGFGTVYMGTSLGPLDHTTDGGYLYAIDQKTGQVKWRFRTKGGVIMTPAFSRRGSVNFGDNSGMMYSLAPDGKQRWRHQIAGFNIFNGVLTDNAGTVFVVTHTFSGTNITSSTLYKLLPDGAIEWSRPLNDVCYGLPFFNLFANVTVVDDNGELYSYDYAGNLTYNFTMADSPIASLAGGSVAYRNAAFAFTTSGDNLRFNSYDNTVNLSVPLGENAMTAVSITDDPKSVFGTRTLGPTPELRLNLYDGATEVWDMAIPGAIMTNIALDASGRMYFATFNADGGGELSGNGIFCILPDQTTAWFYPTPDLILTNAILADENLVVCATSTLGASSENTTLIGIHGT